MLISVIIPAYNEELLITDLVQRVSAIDLSPHAKEIIVVNDGSTDGTATALMVLTEKIPNLHVINLPDNCGKSSALQKGFSVASGDIILVQDADLEYSPADYPHMIAPFENPEVQVVYGSRFLKKSWPDNMKIHNWLANRFFTLLSNLLFNSGITDEGTAYKVFRSNLLRSIPLRTRGFAFCAEITCRLGEKGIAIHEVPVSYRARTVREGKKPRFYDGVAIVLTIVGIWLGSRLKKAVPNGRE